MLACHWDAFCAYRLCQPTFVVAGRGLVHLGVSAAECRAAITLLRYPRAQWPALVDAIQHLGNAVAAELNRRAR